MHRSSTASFASLASLAVSAVIAAAGCGSSPAAESARTATDTGTESEPLIGHICPEYITFCPASYSRVCTTTPNGCSSCACEGPTLHFENATYSLYASVGGGAPHLVQLDTGSTGLYVPTGSLGAGATKTTKACSVTYVSSGTTLTGVIANAQVALLGATASGELASAPTTATMPVCAIDDPTFANDGVMGVGFGTHTNQSTLGPAYNVLLQIQGITNPGYILSTHPTPSVQIGITPAGGAGFELVNLTASTATVGDWTAGSLVGCLKTPSFSQCGALLVDTGIADSLLWGPSDPTLGGLLATGQTVVPNGTALQITSGSGAATLDYSFVVGQGSDTPSSVNVRTASTFSINTGRALLVDDDYLFDGVNGQVGFRAAD